MDHLTHADRWAGLSYRINYPFQIKTHPGQTIPKAIEPSLNTHKAYLVLCTKITFKAACQA